MDVKNARQQNQLDRVNKLYVSGSYTIDEACKKVGICRKTYYNIKNKSGKTGKINNQKGGHDKKIINKNVNNIIDNEQENTDNQALFNEIQDGIRNRSVRRAGK